MDNLYNRAVRYTANAQNYEADRMDRLYGWTEKSVMMKDLRRMK